MMTRIIEIDYNYHSKNAKANEFHGPPLAAEKLLFALLPKTDRDEIIGDLQEDCETANDKYGAKYARRWYWWQMTSLVILMFVRRFRGMAHLMELST